jgi:hypothetical protein
MKKGIRQIRICRWCSSQVKENICDGKFKGYLKTCGSKSCLTAANNDSAINGRKAWVRTKVCQKCGASHTSRSSTSRWCKTCSPGKKDSNKLARYNMSKPEWDIMIKEQKGLCRLCPKKAMVIDHNHNTGQVRGLLCDSCNLLLGILEIRGVNWIKKAQKYAISK